MTEGEPCRDIWRVTSSAAMIFSFPDMEIADGTLRYPKGYRAWGVIGDYGSSVGGFRSLKRDIGAI